MKLEGGEPNPAFWIDADIVWAWFCSDPCMLRPSRMRVVPLDSLTSFFSSLSVSFSRRPSGHIFHPDCVDSWLRVADCCPVCRTVVWPPPYLADRDGLARALALQMAVRQATGAPGAVRSAAARRTPAGQRSRGFGVRRQTNAGTLALTEVALASLGFRAFVRQPQPQPQRASQDNGGTQASRA